MNYIRFMKWLPVLIQGLEITVIGSVVSITTSLLWGSLIAMIQAYDNKIASVLTRIYVSVFRNLPLLVIMFFCFYGLPLIGIEWSPLTCGILAITLNEGAFVAEIIRGSIQNLPHGEIEAACSLGLSKAEVVRKIVFPLGLRNSVPMLVSHASVMIKDTSLFSMIMIVDLTRAGNIFYDEYLDSISIWIIAGVYIVLFVLFVLVGRIAERKAIVRR